MSIFPLIDWGWNRARCLDYLEQQFGIVWSKSACVYCPFNRLTTEAIERHRRHPDQVAEALLLEHLSLSLNPRGTLYPGKSLVQITNESGNQSAMRSFNSRLDELGWAVYRVRRIYSAAKDGNGKVLSDKKGNAIRAVERITEELSRAAALKRLREFASPLHEVGEQRGITYFYRLRCAKQYPTREEFLVAVPAAVETKARYGLDWFERQWESPQGRLFE